MHLLFILFKPLVHMLTAKAVNNHPNLKNTIFFGKYQIVLEQMKDSTKSKFNCATSIDAAGVVPCEGS